MHPACKCVDSGDPSSAVRILESRHLAGLQPFEQRVPADLDCGRHAVVVTKPGLDEVWAVIMYVHHEQSHDSARIQSHACFDLLLHPHPWGGRCLQIQVWHPKVSVTVWSGSRNLHSNVWVDPSCYRPGDVCVRLVGYQSSMVLKWLRAVLAGLQEADWRSLMSVSRVGADQMTMRRMCDASAAAAQRHELRALGVP